MAERRDINHHAIDTEETHRGPGAQIWHQGFRMIDAPAPCAAAGTIIRLRGLSGGSFPDSSALKTGGPSSFSPVHPTPYRSDELCEIFLLKLLEKIEIKVAIEELLNDLEQPLFRDVGV